MAPKKLSESEKKEIVQLYGKPEESTATLASRFGVSSSTISRVLKQSLSGDDYNALVQQKRTGSQSIQSPSKIDVVSEVSDPSQEQSEIVSAPSAPKTKSKQSSPKRSPIKQVAQRMPGEQPASDSMSADHETTAEASAVEINTFPSKPKTKSKSTLSIDENTSRRRRKRSRTTDDDDDVTQLPIAQLHDSEDDDTESDAPSSWKEIDKPVLRSGNVQADPVSYARDDDDESDELLSEEEDLDDDLLDDDDDFDDDLDSELDDDDDESDEDALNPIKLKSVDVAQIFPFSAAELPRTCYLVIDRSAELITRPLQEFGELGDFPSAELSESTLPVFDNHRVAKRFANRRTQRIVKIPDSRILRKTMPYLQSKGITRLLIDGQVYSLTE